MSLSLARGLQPGQSSSLTLLCSTSLATHDWLWCRVHKDHRRQGYGKQLIEQFRQHPELGDVAHFELYTKEEPFYVKLGFRTLNSRLHFMRWVRPGKFDPFRG